MKNETLRTPSIQEFSDRVKEYADDPNCYADLWATDKAFSDWTKEAKDSFISIGVSIKRLSYKHETL